MKNKFRLILCALFSIAIIVPTAQCSYRANTVKSIMNEYPQTHSTIMVLSVPWGISTKQLKRVKAGNFRDWDCVFQSNASYSYRYYNEYHDFHFNSDGELYQIRHQLSGQPDRFFLYEYDNFEKGYIFKRGNVPDYGYVRTHLIKPIEYTFVWEDKGEVKTLNHPQSQLYMAFFIADAERTDEFDEFASFYSDHRDSKYILSMASKMTFTDGLLIELTYMGSEIEGESGTLTAVFTNMLLMP